MTKDDAPTVVRPPLLLVATVVAMTLMSGVMAAAIRADGSAAQPSWTCIAGVCLGHARAALDYRHGVRPSDIPSRVVRVPGGRVWACFWRCTYAVTEDGFTYYGGTVRPANRVLNVNTCHPIARLPDGTGVGTTVPFGKRWNGYRQTGIVEALRFGWQKKVRTGATKTRVTLAVDKGRVQCIWLERMP